MSEEFCDNWTDAYDRLARGGNNKDIRYQFYALLVSAAVEDNNGRFTVSAKALRLVSERMNSPEGMLWAPSVTDDGDMVIELTPEHPKEGK